MSFPTHRKTVFDKHYNFSTRVIKNKGKALQNIILGRLVLAFDMIDKKYKLDIM